MPEPAAAGVVGQRLDRAFYSVPAEVLARRLIGRLMVRRLTGGEQLVGRIVETEAYTGVKDRASHAFGARRTARNQSMYGRPGLAYVYFTYGMHHCMNVVCGEEGDPLAVLIRALEPVVGLEKMAELRKARAKVALHSRKALGPSGDARLCAGPARLCQALAIDRGCDGLDLVTESSLFIADPAAGPPTRPKLLRTTRVGIDYAGAWADRKLRWLLAGSPSVSVPVRTARNPGRGSGRD